jgi:hypothetical protein
MWLRETTIPGVSLIPSSSWLMGIKNELRSEDALQRALGQFVREYPASDYVLLDCPPALGILTVNALMTAGEFVAPVEAHRMAVDGLGRLLETVAFVRERLNPHLAPTGILACRVDARTRHALDVVEFLRKRYREPSHGHPRKRPARRGSTRLENRLPPMRRRAPGPKTTGSWRQSDQTGESEMRKKTTMPERPQPQRPHEMVLPSPSEPKPELPAKPIKVRITTMIAAEVEKKASQAVYWTPGMTMSGFVEGAMAREAERLERERSGPFPDGDVVLRTGRPYQRR